MSKILFYGDPHGNWNPLKQAIADPELAAVVLLGDCDLERPLHEELAEANTFGLPIYFIPGNHDADREHYYRHLFESKMSENNIHARLVDIGGLKVAGFGGVFRGEIWHPDLNDGEPSFATREQFLWQLPKQKKWRRVLPMKHRVSIWYEDYEALFDQTCDILVTHDAPTSHRYGLKPFDDLAEVMNSSLIVHGHHHESYRSTLSNNTDVIGLAKSEVFILDCDTINSKVL